jgi:hypothetical protein
MWEKNPQNYLEIETMVWVLSGCVEKILTAMAFLIGFTLFLKNINENFTLFFEDKSAFSLFLKRAGGTSPSAHNQQLSLRDDADAEE